METGMISMENIDDICVFVDGLPYSVLKSWARVEVLRCHRAGLSPIEILKLFRGEAKVE